MREKELRIALVCFGGVSLAVYMHGVSWEILKLARASSALHSITDRTKRRSAAFFDIRPSNDPEYDTEAFYFELLRDIGGTIELRVIVDIIAGASAGGINGTMLARALCHDLPMSGLRDLWLQNADVTELLAPEARARRWSKWFLRPLFWAAGLAGFDFVKDAEVRAKLLLFMRSRWFKPPLGGTKMAALMYDAVTAMGGPRQPNASLLPSGQGLDLFVTVTDFYGAQQLMQIHDPPVIHEREHRHVLHFKYRRHSGGVVDSDFDLDNAPALAFAARATSSIPGAFPPAQIVEIDRLVASRGADWPRRADFLASNFEKYAEMNIDVSTVPFVDGSVLNSRPFREAVTAIRGRPAYREVDRRVVYIDPNPASPGAPVHRGLPGFFSALKGAMSDIPLTEPVKDELDWIAASNERVRRLRTIIEGARSHIARLVSELVTSGDGRLVTEENVRDWRMRANAKAVHDAGFAYEAYVRLKLASMRSFISNLIVEMRGVRAGSPFARAIAEIIDAWADLAGAGYEPADSPSLAAESAANSGILPKWVSLLLALDVDYRRRRLHFIIEGQNRLYQMVGSPGFEDLDPLAVDRLKRMLYECVEALERRATAGSLDGPVTDLVDDIFRSGPSPSDVKDIGKYAQAFAMRHRDQLDRLVERIATAIDLDSSTRELDALLAGLKGWPSRAMREVLVNYLGFPFWDVLTFPVLPWRQAGEFNEMRVDRISAQDCVTMERLGGFQLKGIAFNLFAAFLSRAYRENDYLLGRLHGVDRLIDIVCDAAGPDAHAGIDIRDLKRKAIRRVLDVEEPQLPTCKAMIAALRSALDVT